MTCRHPGGCPRPARAQGWCEMHFSRIRRSGDPGPAAIRTPPWKLDELIVEVEHLAGSDGPGFLAARLGMKPTSLSARLRRAGRIDLAVIFDRTNAA